MEEEGKSTSEGGLNGEKHPAMGPFQLWVFCGSVSSHPKVICSSVLTLLSHLSTQCSARGTKEEKFGEGMEAD